jgi:carboxyl-terminal processing protease
MEWTKIDPVDYSQSVVQLDNLDKLRKNSEQRIGDNPTFQKIYENAQRLKEQRDMTAYPIGLEAFQNFEKEQEERANQYKDMFDEIVIEGVKNLEVDLPSIHADESKEARNEDWIKSVSKDLYIKETINIMHDMLSLK